mmetsp:Transcript_1589/g.3981  ORF Transcript_1589/g.3981 Transcript_1589/m.3981 type:complete len:251 (-) Transcript_1589:212-964(-)
MARPPAKLRLAPGDRARPAEELVHHADRQRPQHPRQGLPLGPKGRRPLQEGGLRPAPLRCRGRQRLQEQGQARQHRREGRLAARLSQRKRLDGAAGRRPRVRRPARVPRRELDVPEHVGAREHCGGARLPSQRRHAAQRRPGRGFHAVLLPLRQQHRQAPVGAPQVHVQGPRGSARHPQEHCGPRRREARYHREEAHHALLRRAKLYRDRSRCRLVHGGLHAARHHDEGQRRDGRRYLVAHGGQERGRAA